MKAFSKLGLLVAVALLAAAAVATSAQGQTALINPENTPVSGVADFPTLDYEGTTIVCDTGTADSATGASVDRITDLSLEFFGNCSVAGILQAVVDCEGFATIIAEQNVAPGGTGTVRLNGADEPNVGDPAFHCEVTTDLCVVTVDGPQDTDSGNLELDESTDILSANVNVEAANNGSELCGPPTGTGNFSGDYLTTPSNLTIDSP
jgi:hypothetical protein